MQDELDHFLRHRIVFEGVTLPKAALLLDHLGMYDNLPTISEETSEWCWRFTICIGRTRTDASENVVAYASELLNGCRSSKHRLMENFAKHFTGQTEPQFFDEWIWTLEKITEIARSRDSCSWEAPLIPGDHNYGKTWSETSTEALERLERNVEHSTGQKRRFWQQMLNMVRSAMKR